MNWSNPVMIHLIETIVIKINRSCLLTVQGSMIEIYDKFCLIDLVTFLVMCQLWFEFVHGLNLLLYNYHDNSCLVRWFLLWWDKYNKLFVICFQSNIKTISFNLLRHDYDVVTYDFIYPTCNDNWNRVFLSLYLIKRFESFWYIVTAITSGKWLCWIRSYHIRYVSLLISIGYETVLLLFDYDLTDFVVTEEQSVPISVSNWIILILFNVEW